jgi:hypothetical protein
MDLQDMLNQVTGGDNADSVGQAASDHVAAMPPDEVADHVQTAAANASANGNTDVANELGDLISRAESDPGSLKTAAIAYIQQNPQVLAHFAPSFAQGILSRI